MEVDQTNDVVDRISSLSVKEDKVEETFQKEFGSRLRLSKGALLIQEAGNRLHCSILTLTKAMVLFHKLKRNSKLNTSCVTPVACLNLSIKLCEEDVSIDEVVLKSYHAILDLETTRNPMRPNPSSEELLDMKKNLNLAEFALCRAMCFKLDCEIAHMYVYRVLAQLQSLTDASESVIVSISSSVTKLLSTYYLCEGCLDYTADEIALACLQFAYLYCGTVSSSIKQLLKKELTYAPNKGRICDIVDHFILVSDVSTTLNYI